MTRRDGKKAQNREKKKDGREGAGEGGREGSLTELLVSQTPMGMSGGEKGAGLSPYIYNGVMKNSRKTFVKVVFCVPTILNSLALGWEPVRVFSFFLLFFFEGLINKCILNIPLYCVGR